MRNYILSIDTETDGIPKEWDKPYDDTSWPHALQISWVVADSKGNIVTQQDYYVKYEQFDEKTGNTNVHNITRSLLLEKGISTKVIIDNLAADIQQYNPLVIGHFVKLDYHIIGAECARDGRENVLKSQPLYCTMIGSSAIARDYGKSFLRLTDLYQVLFQKAQAQPHNALDDAISALQCMVKMKKLGFVSMKSALDQKPLKQDKNHAVVTSRLGWGMAIMVIMLILFLLVQWQFN